MSKVMWQSATFTTFSPYVPHLSCLESGGVTHWRVSTSVGKVRGKPLTWQDVLHQRKVIDQRVPQPTVLHAVATRGTDTVIVADTQQLPIRAPLIPPREVVEAVGVAVAGPVA